MLLNTKQVALQLGVSRKCVTTWVSRGILKAVRHGNSGKWQVDLSKQPHYGYIRKPEKRANACYLLTVRGLHYRAILLYHRLSESQRTAVDGMCARKGIDSPGLRLKQLQAPRPTVVHDMTREGAD